MADGTAVTDRRAIVERSMTYKAPMIAVLIGLAAAGFSFAGPAEAGTCSPVKAKGTGKNVARATDDAQDNLRKKARAMGGKVTQTSSNCVPGPSGVVCKINAVVCPK
jgi:hypothetical protein